MADPRLAPVSLSPPPWAGGTGRANSAGVRGSRALQFSNPNHGLDSPEPLRRYWRCGERAAAGLTRKWDLSRARGSAGGAGSVARR
jgi:hypothetical protein